MLILVVILLSVLLVLSVVANILLWRAGERQLEIKEMYYDWISEWRFHVLKTYSHMKILDDKQMFEKDDEVGVVFEDMKILIDSLNDKIEEVVEEETT